MECDGKLWWLLCNYLQKRQTDMEKRKEKKEKIRKTNCQNETKEKKS